MINRVIDVFGVWGEEFASFTYTFRQRKKFNKKAKISKED
jgi:hypothetical protein